MTEKCDKYETLFVFGTDEELAKHLEICEDCQVEHEIMQQTQNLVKEAKSYYQKPEKGKISGNLIKIAAGLAILSLAYFSANNLIYDDQMDSYDLTYIQNESVVSEMGLPTDEYGLLMVY